MATFPDYESPPINEVVIGLQFNPLAEFTVGHAGLYWATIKDEFNHVEQQAPIEHIVESTKSDSPSAAGEKFRIQVRPQVPRLWFVTPSPGNWLIQLQRDRFLLNWRKMTEGSPYPRFERIRDRFFEHWHRFRYFLQQEQIQLPGVDQCELTYVNHIQKGEGWNCVEEAFGLFTTLSWNPRHQFLSPPEHIDWSVRIPLPGKNGRLHVNIAQVAVPKCADSIIRMTLTTRGIPQETTDNHAIPNWFDMAHEHIVKGFVDLVDEKTDALWGKKS